MSAERVVPLIAPLLGLEVPAHYPPLLIGPEGSAGYHDHGRLAARLSAPAAHRDRDGGLAVLDA
jgi:hypothetical protein